ncbi:MAG TPA: hypothetical protein V6D29_11205 [Leptolyngbyaceae cyanobacterium]
MEPRILTLWQPYASLVALLIKIFETRPKYTSYRGPLYVHSAAQTTHKTSDAEYDLFLEALALAGLGEDDIGPFDPRKAYGQILVKTQLKECLYMVNVPGTPPPKEGRDTVVIPSTKLERLVGNWSEGRYAYRLEDRQPLKTPIPWSGGQGFIKAPQKIIDLVEENL